MIRTKRLTLRLPRESDAPFFYQLMNSDGWLKYIGDRGISDVDKARDYISDSLLKMYTDFGHTLFLVELQGECLPVGICGLLQRTYLDSPDLGFAILPQYQRQGYVMEASRGVIAWAAAALNAQRLYAYTDLDNKPSQHLLERLDFSHEGDRYIDELSARFSLFSYEF